MKKYAGYVFRHVRTAIILILAGAVLLSVQAAAKTDYLGGKMDKIKVIYAAEGYLSDEAGNKEPFIFGAVKLHKKGAPADEWIPPNFFFEFNKKGTLAITGQYENFIGPWKDGTIRTLPALKGIQAVFTNYDYAKYNKEEYAKYGLSGGGTPHEFEIYFAFTKDGFIEVNKSSMGIVPKEYMTGRKVILSQSTGQYYKKGSKTERFVPVFDSTGKIVNRDEAGESIYEERPANVTEVCYEFSDEAIPLSPKVTPIEGEVDLKNGLTHYKKTGVCSYYKVSSISRSMGLPDSYALGVMED